MASDAFGRLLGRAAAWSAGTGAGLVAAIMAVAQVLDEEGVRTWSDLAGVLVYVWLGAAVGLVHGLVVVPVLLLALRLGRGVLLPSALGALAAAVPLTLVLWAASWGADALIFGGLAALLALGPIVLVVRAERRQKVSP